MCADCWRARGIPKRQLLHLQRGKETVFQDAGGRHRACRPAPARRRRHRPAGRTAETGHEQSLHRHDRLRRSAHGRPVDEVRRGRLHPEAAD